MVYSNDPSNIVALSSIVAAKGFYRTDQTAKMYPCMGFYSGTNKQLVDFKIENNAWCGLREPIFVARSYGASAIGPGGTVTFTIPLPNTMWDKNKIVEDNRRCDSCRSTAIPPNATKAGWRVRRGTWSRKPIAVTVATCKPDSRSGSVTVATCEPRLLLGHSGHMQTRLPLGRFL